MRISRNFIFSGAAALALALIMPDFAFATDITEFSGPFEKVMHTITGPVGKWISMTMMAACGFVFWARKEDLEGGFKLLLGIVFAISFISFASSIVSSVFSFSTGCLI